MAIVLITTDRRAGIGVKPGEKVRPVRDELFLTEAYAEAVRGAGGTPLLLPPGATDLPAILDRVDAVVLTGGHFDIHPRHYGQEVEGRLDRVEEARTALELALALACVERDIPVLGVCGGMQAMAVATGGTLVQHLHGPPATLEHEQPTDPATPWHAVRCTGLLEAILGTTTPANSTHHQAVAHPGAFESCGWTEDGVVEAMALPGHRFAVGVQWHPELLGDLRVYRALLETVRTSA